MHQAGKFPLERLRKVYSAVDFNFAVQDLKDGKVSYFL